MGIGGVSIWQLVIVLAIVIMIFGTKRLRNLGGDLGSAIKGFRNAISSEQDKTEQLKSGQEATSAPKMPQTDGMTEQSSAKHKDMN